MSAKHHRKSPNNRLRERARPRTRGEALALLRHAMVVSGLLLLAGSYAVNYATDRLEIRESELDIASTRVSSSMNDFFVYNLPLYHIVFAPEPVLDSMLTALDGDTTWAAGAREYGALSEEQRAALRTVCSVARAITEKMYMDLVSTQALVDPHLDYGRYGRIEEMMADIDSTHAAAVATLDTATTARAAHGVMNAVQSLRWDRIDMSSFTTNTLLSRIHEESKMVHSRIETLRAILLTLIVAGSLLLFASEALDVRNSGWKTLRLFLAGGLLLGASYIVGFRVREYRERSGIVRNALVTIDNFHSSMLQYRLLEDVSSSFVAIGNPLARTLDDRNKVLRLQATYASYAELGILLTKNFDLPTNYQFGQDETLDRVGRFFQTAGRELFEEGYEPDDGLNPAVVQELRANHDAVNARLLELRSHLAASSVGIGDAARRLDVVYGTLYIMGTALLGFSSLYAVGDSERRRRRNWGGRDTNHPTGH